MIFQKNARQKLSVYRMVNLFEILFCIYAFIYFRVILVFISYKLQFKQCPIADLVVHVCVI